MDYYTKRIIQRAQKDIEKGDLSKAIARYEGFFRSSCTNKIIHHKVGELYLAVGDKVRAGKHLYFKEHPSIEEQACIAAFEKNYGYSPTLLLRQLVYREAYRLRKLDLFTQKKLYELIQLSTQECGVTPKFLLGRRNQLTKILAKK